MRLKIASGTGEKILRGKGVLYRFLFIKVHSFDKERVKGRCRGCQPDRMSKPAAYMEARFSSKSDQARYPLSFCKRPKHLREIPSDDTESMFLAGKAGCSRFTTNQLQPALIFSAAFRRASFNSSG